MRKIALPVWTVIGAFLIIVGVILLGHFSQHPIDQGASIAGQAAGTTSQVYLRGGLLQQNLGDAAPQAFLEEETAQSIPGFTVRSFTVHEGEMVSITLTNRSTTGHEHGWMLVSPGTREKVEREAKEAGPKWGWIPNSTDVLAYVPMTPPGESKTALFRAPPVAGDYPFFCPFPGHGAAMNGVLHVVR